MGLIEKEYRNGEVIIAEGESGKNFYRILKGKVGVYADYQKKDHLNLAILGYGEFFGEMAILDDYPRSATVVANGDVLVVEIPGDELNVYLEENPDSAIALMKLLGGRIQTMAADCKDALNLLSELKEADANKKKSFFDRIKKHQEIYLNVKDQIPPPSSESYLKAFAEITDEGTGHINVYESGDVLFREGETDDCMFILREGKVGIYDQSGNKVSELEAVSFMGEMGMIAGEPRDCTVVVETDDCCIERVRHDDLEALVRSCPVKVDMILRHLSFRVRALTIDFYNTCKEITERYGEK